MTALADFNNPQEPPEDVPSAPIEDYLWVLMIIGIAFIFYKINSNDKTLNNVKK